MSRRRPFLAACSLAALFSAPNHSTRIDPQVGHSDGRVLPTAVSQSLVESFKDYVALLEFDPALRFSEYLQEEYGLSDEDLYVILQVRLSPEMVAELSEISGSLIFKW